MALDDRRRPDARSPPRRIPAPAATSQGELTNLIATIGENMRCAAPPALGVRGRRRRLHAQPGGARLGKIGVLVALEVDRRQGQARGARQAARHARGRRQPAVADRRPSLDPAVVERERAMLTEQARAERQGRRHRRQDGRGPDPQVLPGGACCSSRPSSSTARPRSSTGRRRGGQGGRRAGRGLRASCASPWARASRRSPSDFAAEVAAQLKQASMTTDTGARAVEARAVPKKLQLHEAPDAVDAPLSPRPAEALGRGADGRVGEYGLDPAMVARSPRR